MSGRPRAPARRSIPTRPWWIPPTSCSSGSSPAAEARGQDPAHGLEDLVHGDPLHAHVVRAARLTVVERVDAGAARDAGPDRVAPRSLRREQERGLGAEERDDVDARQRREVRGAAVVRDKDLRKPEDNEKLPQRRSPREAHAARGADPARDLRYPRGLPRRAGETC